MSSEKKKENFKEKDFIVEKILNKRITDEGKLEYFLKWKDLPDSDNAWKSVETVDCPELVKAYEDSIMCESLEKKRKLTDIENISTGSVVKKAYVDKSNGAQMHIDLLPEEILVKIFQFIPQNELGRIARVSRIWYELTRCPFLWKKVYVQFQWRHGSQNKVVSIFYESLPSCVTHLKLDFLFFHHLEWKERLKFQEFCVKLGEKCPSLKTLILYGACFSVSLQSVIDLSRQYIKNLQVLSLHYCDFTEYSMKGGHSDFSEIKILDFFCNHRIGPSTKLTFSKMSSLKKLVLTEANDEWFRNDISFLDNLEVLNLQWAEIGSGIFQILQNHALMLTELYLCGANLRDTDFRFSNSVFPQLKTICLSGCHRVTCEGVVSLLRSCQSLQNVYVNRRVSESYAMHPFVFAYISKLEIVKSTELCQHFIKNYLNED